MARPIKETPILRGSDAVKFIEKMNKKQLRPFSPCEKKEMNDTYKKFRAISKF